MPNLIRLKFIGKDGSMGLDHGRNYLVSVYNKGKYIWVDWFWRACPYSSPQTFAENWTIGD